MSSEQNELTLSEEQIQTIADSVDWLTVVYPLYEAPYIMRRLQVYKEFIPGRGRWGFHESKEIAPGTWILAGGIYSGDQELCALVLSGDGLEYFRAAGRFRDVLEVALEGRVSRLDLQITIEHTGFSIAGRLREAMERGLLRTKMRRWTYIKSDSGETFTLGRRTSSRYVRVYDKGAEQGQTPGVLWRFEVEYKRTGAGYVFRKLLGGANVRDYIFVFDVVAERGSNITRAPLADWWEKIIAGREVVGEYSPSKTRQRLARRLEWLLKQVLPAYQDTVNLLDELGLESYVLNMFTKKVDTDPSALRLAVLALAEVGL